MTKIQINDFQWFKGIYLNFFYNQVIGSDLIMIRIQFSEQAVQGRKKGNSLSCLIEIFF